MTEAPAPTAPASRPEPPPINDYRLERAVWSAMRKQVGARPDQFRLELNPDNWSELCDTTPVELMEFPIGAPPRWRGIPVHVIYDRPNIEARIMLVTELRP